MPPLRRAEDEIRGLCGKILDERGEQELIELLASLRALHNHAQRLRARFALLPFSVERRNRSEETLRPEDVVE